MSGRMKKGGIRNLRFSHHFFPPPPPGGGPLGGGGDSFGGHFCFISSMRFEISLIWFSYLFIASGDVASFIHLAILSSCARVTGVRLLILTRINAFSTLTPVPAHPISPLRIQRIPPHPHRFRQPLLQLLRRRRCSCDALVAGKGRQNLRNSPQRRRQVVGIL